MKLDVNGPPEPAQAGGQPTPDRVTAAAAALLRTKGYSATTTREIAAELGIQKASLYHHISRKDDLLFEIVIGTTRRSLEILRGAGAAFERPIDQLKATFQAHLQGIHGDIDKNVVALTEMRSLDGERLAQVLEVRDEYQRVLRDVIRACQADGSVRDDIDANLLALAALSLANWTIVWFQPDQPLSVDQMASTLFSILLRGAAGPAPD